MNDNIEIRAKLKLDTEEAESQLAKMSQKKSSGIEISLPKDTKIELPDATKKSLNNLFKREAGLLNVAKIAQGATGGIKGLMNAMKGLAGAAGVATTAIAGVIAVVAIVLKLLQGTDTMMAMQQALTRLTNAFRDVLAPVLALIGELVIVLADSLASLAPVLKASVGIVANILNVVVGILKVLQPFFELLGKINELIGAIASIFTDLAGGVMSSLFEIIIKLVDVALKPLFKVLEVFIDFIDRIKEVIQNFITALTFGLVTFERTTLASTQATKVGFKTSLDTWETSGTETASERQARLAAEAAESASRAAEEARRAAESFTVKIKEFLSALGEGIGKVVGKVMEGISTTWGLVKDGVVGTWKKVKDSVVEGWDKVRDKVRDIASNIVEGAGKLLKDAVGNIKTVAGKVASGAKDLAVGIGEAIGRVGGKIATGAKGLWNKIKFWDDGGTLSKGAQIWAMSERGNPEFIFNAGGHDTVINADILANAMYNALMKAGVGKTQKLEVSVREGIASGPRELAQMLLPSLQFLLKGGY